MNTVTMKNVLHRNKWNVGVVQLQLEPPTTPLIKLNHNDKLDKDFVKLKMRRDPASEKPDRYEFKMALFENGNPEWFFLFVRNFNMTIKASVILETAKKVKYICTLVRGDALIQFDWMYSDVKSTNPLTV